MGQAANITSAVQYINTKKSGALSTANYSTAALNIRTLNRLVNRANGVSASNADSPNNGNMAGDTNATGRRWIDTTFVKQFVDKYLQTYPTTLTVSASITGSSSFRNGSTVQVIFNASTKTITISYGSFVTTGSGTQFAQYQPSLSNNHVGQSLCIGGYFTLAPLTPEQIQFFQHWGWYPDFDVKINFFGWTNTPQWQIGGVELSQQFRVQIQSSGQVLVTPRGDAVIAQPATDNLAGNVSVVKV